jgi:hypothetical protein
MGKIGAGLEGFTSNLWRRPVGKIGRFLGFRPMISKFEFFARRRKSEFGDRNFRGEFRLAEHRISVRGAERGEPVMPFGASERTGGARPGVEPLGSGSTPGSVSPATGRE